MSQREIDQGRFMVARELLRSDAAAGLKLLHELGDYGPMSGMGVIAISARDPQVAANLFREANEREPGRMRSSILEGLAGSAMLNGGGDAVNEVFAKIENLGDTERNQLVSKLISDFVPMDPKWAIEFVRQQASDSYRSDALRNVVVYWAREDYNAAGKWLGEQPPSPERDKMIAGFAKQMPR